MAEYIEKPKVVIATQWQKVGDHSDIVALTTEDKSSICKLCGYDMEVHGVRKGNPILANPICPGTWIVNDTVIDDKTFQERYEAVKEEF